MAPNLNSHFNFLSTVIKVVSRYTNEIFVFVLLDTIKATRGGS